jgi:hypothetical protein
LLLVDALEHQQTLAQVRANRIHFAGKCANDSAAAGNATILHPASGRSFVLDCTDHSREYRPASAAGDGL